MAFIKFKKPEEPSIKSIKPRGEKYRKQAFLWKLTTIIEAGIILAFIIGKSRGYF